MMIFVAVYALLLGLVMAAGGAPEEGAPVIRNIFLFLMRCVGTAIGAWAVWYLGVYIFC